MIRAFLNEVRQLFADRKGVSAAEYAILAVGIVIVVGAAVVAFKPKLTEAFNAIGDQIEAQQNAITEGGTTGG